MIRKSWVRIFITQIVITYLDNAQTNIKAQQSIIFCRADFEISVFFLSTHRSVGPLLATVLAGPTSELSFSGSLDVDRVDDVKELLDHGHLLVHEVHHPVHCLQRKKRSIIIVVIYPVGLNITEVDY